ncbi:MAG: TetR family transcriptional regulator C-terminal domain-containing protein [Gemmatimonadetes bacterium]|nr:TetR family transcriptional regulator C-terminal domain-containing protein [Gemmatimonadota bacterium]
MPGQKAAEADRQDQILTAAMDVATRHGLEGLTIRRVASEAGLSHGLVHFHFKSKAELLVALLDRLFTDTAAFIVGPEIAGISAPLQRLMALLQQEMRRITSDRARIHLFFDFWLMGTRHPRIRARMRAELARYREAFRPMVDEVLRSEPHRFENVTAEALSAVVVAFIKGSAVQAVIDPRGLDVTQFTAAAHALLSQMEAASAA